MVRKQPIMGGHCYVMLNGLIIVINFTLLLNSHNTVYIVMVCYLSPDTVMKAEVLLCLLSALVEVHPQIVPYINFMGTNLSNHSYVNLNLVGENRNGVQCHTDLITCCHTNVGPDRGDWYFPNGERLNFSRNTQNGTFVVRFRQRVNVHRRGSQKISGLYRCEIETNAVNNKSGNETLYAGLYTNGGQ